SPHVLEISTGDRTMPASKVTYDVIPGEINLELSIDPQELTVAFNFDKALVIQNRKKRRESLSELMRAGSLDDRKRRLAQLMSQKEKSKSNKDDEARLNEEIREITEIYRINKIENHMSNCNEAELSLEVAVPIDVSNSVAVATFGDF